MAKAWRLVLLTAAVGQMAAAVVAAQTVYVRNAPPGTNVEVVVNAASAGSGAVDPSGEAKVGFKLPEGKTEMDANILVDTCDKLRKVVIVDRARPAPPPAEGCDRREVAGIYWVRPVNTIVVDVGALAPALLLVRRDYTPPKPTVEGQEEEHPSRPLPTGLLMFAGGDFTNFRDAAVLACGNATCDPKNSGFGYTFGATVWFTRFLGVEGSYLKPHQVSATGGDGYAFKTTLDSDIWTIAGTVGAQAGVVRIYGKGGTNYHVATNTTVQTAASL